MPWIFIIAPWVNPRAHGILAILTFLSALTFMISLTLATHAHQNKPRLNQTRLSLSICAGLFMIGLYTTAPMQLYHTLATGKTKNQIIHLVSQTITIDYPTHALFEGLMVATFILFLATLTHELSPPKTKHRVTPPH